MAAKVRWGILSTANIGRAAMVPALHLASNAELVAVASRDAERAYGYATRYAVPHSYGSYEELLRDREVDVVYVPLPNSMHHTWAMMALHAGKHVLVEKPMGLSAAECLELAAAADANGVRLMEGFMYRFHPQISTLLTLIDNGAIGRLSHMQTAFTFRLQRADNIRLQPELGGGSLMDVGCYCVNICRTIADEEPVEVSALAKWHAGGVDESMCGTLRFASGVTAQFDCSLGLARRETFLAAGTDGTIELPRAFLPGTAATQVVLRKGYSDVDTRTVAGVDEYRLMVEHFSECVYTNTSPLFDAREAALNMRVIEALYQSAAVYGAPVAVEPLHFRTPAGYAGPSYPSDLPNALSEQTPQVPSPVAPATVAPATVAPTVPLVAAEPAPTSYEAPVHPEADSTAPIGAHPVADDTVRAEPPAETSVAGSTPQALAIESDEIQPFAADAAESRTPSPT